MGKQGPCCHCGVTSTPLWRNGPPEKPVLCNACGSRWRTKGTLVNYTPLHARADPDEYEDHRVSRMKSISINKNKDMKLLKRKANNDNIVMGGTFPDYNYGYRKVLDEDASNRSSSGSAISNSESCAQFGSADASDLTGPAQSNVWETVVPSKKRTCVNRPKQSPVEKLTKDLYTIWHEQQSSCFSESSEEDLLFESETPMVSVEIGHGSVLIRHPSSIARDEESEASSLSVENKLYGTNEAYSRSVGFPVHNESNKNNLYTPSSGVEKAKNPTGQWMLQEQLKRDKSQHERTQFLASHSSPLCDVDLNDILTFEEFSRCLTNEEQQQLLKYLPPVDSIRFPDSVKSLFDSSQFKENICWYQKLLEEGVFDLSFSGAKPEDSNTLKRLTLSNFSKSKWVQHYHQLKKSKNSTGKSPVGRAPNIFASSNMVSAKRSRDGQGQKFPEVKMKSPKRMNMKATYETKEMDNDTSCFSPRSLFALPPPDGGSMMMDSLHYTDENSDQDLLVEVPSNGSFPQAELLNPALSYGQKAHASTSSSSTYPNLFRP